jgi:predicted metalloprotease with PDZ domain
VNEGEGGVWDGARSVRDAQKIVEEFYRMWGHLPYERYYFLNVLAERGGGLEHKNSTLMMTTRWATRTPERYLGWLGLVSHEYFHTWNVKRLRPAELGPFDYENENYTRSLWMAEGLTSYYGPLALRRAGLSTPADLLRAYSTSIQALQSTPGRAVQPAELASYDAWIRLYRPDENSRNVSISYYTKGAIIGLLLDAKLRNLTSGARSLDDVMRLAYERYSGPRGFTPEQFRAVVIEVAGPQHAGSLQGWLTRALETGEELDYSEFLDYYGLRFKPESAALSDSPSTAAPAPKPGWTGLVTSNASGRLSVSQVLRGTPGYDAGFNSGDEILAIGDFRVTPETWNQRMAAYRPGDTVSVLISRRDRLMRLETKLGEEPSRRYELQIRPDATSEQKQRQEAWWGAGPAS